MDQSISVVLPVHNAESTLARSIADVLEVLPDLTDRFEVLIVDDGSTDQTQESANELARMFPQLKVVRHSYRQGIPAIVRSCLRQTKGDVVFVQDPSNPLRRSDLLQLQAMRSSTEARAKSGLAKSDRVMVLGNRISELDKPLVATRSV